MVVDGVRMWKEDTRESWFVVEKGKVETDVGGLRHWQKEERCGPNLTLIAAIIAPSVWDAPGRDPK